MVFLVIIERMARIKAVEVIQVHPRLYQEVNPQLEFDVKDCVGAHSGPIKVHRFSGEDAARCDTQRVYGSPKKAFTQLISYTENLPIKINF